MFVRNGAIIGCHCRRLIPQAYHNIENGEMVNPALILNSYKVEGNVMQVRLFNEKKSLDAIKSATEKERSKTPEMPKITLFDQSNNITVTTLENARKIANSKQWRLVRLVDPTIKSMRPVYKLMTDAQFLEEEVKEKQRVKMEKKQKSSSVKGEKLMTVSDRISCSDLDLKIRQAMKWVEKKIEARIVISSSTSNTTKMEELFKRFEDEAKGVGRIVQKRTADGVLKFQIIPPKETKQKHGLTKDNQDLSIENEYL